MQLVRTPQLRTGNRCARIAARLQHLLYVSTPQRVLLPQSDGIGFAFTALWSTLMGIVDSAEGKTHMIREHGTLIVWPSLIAAGLLAAACTDQPNVNMAPKRPSFWVAPPPCPAAKFTGGGRIDPPHPDPDPADRAPGTPGPGERTPIVGKTTFGFNVFLGTDGSGHCIVTKGEIQVVHHPSKTKWHVSIHNGVDDFGETVFASTYNSGRCVLVGLDGMTARVNGQRGSELTRMSACDKGEPGSSPGFGPDSWRWETLATANTPSTAPSGDTDQTLLTGGNIQAH